MRTIGRDLRTGSGASDADLVYAARSGNLQARETLFRRHVRFVHATAFRLAGRFAEPRPVVEETFRQVFASLDQLAHAEALRAWITGIVVKVTHAAIRRRHLRARFGVGNKAETPFDAYAATALSPEAAASGHVERRRADDRLDALDLIPVHAHIRQSQAGSVRILGEAREDGRRTG